MASELVGAIGFLDAVLRGDATLQAIVGQRIWLGSAPQIDPATGELPVYPLILVQPLNNVPTPLTSNNRLKLTATVRVLAVGNTQDLSALTAAGARIDELLCIAVPTSVTVGTVTYPIRASFQLKPYVRGGVEDGIYYQQFGAEYQIEVQSA